MDNLILGVTFGEKHSWRDWGLYMSGPASISVPVPRTNFVDVPGRDGYLDLSTALTGDVTYETREFYAPFYSLVSPEEWPALYSEILNEIQGTELNIYIDEDPGWHYAGRVAVDSVDYDGTWQIEITGTINPYKLKDEITEVSASLTAVDTEITLSCERRPVVPTITVDTETILTWGEGTYTVNAGAHQIPDIRMTKGTHTLKARATSGAGTITVTYQEGKL